VSGTRTHEAGKDNTRSEEPATDAVAAAGTDVAQDLVEVAEAAAVAASTDEAPLGRPGRPLNRRSPYLVGLQGAAGVATTYGLLLLLSASRPVLVLVGLALFLAIGLDPAVRWLNRWLPRKVAVAVVTLTMLGVVAGFLAAAIPPLTTQTAQLIHDFPHYVKQLNDHNSAIGRYNARYHLQQRLTAALSSGGGSSWFGGLLGAGQAVLTGIGETATVLVLTIYFLADMPRIRQFVYRLIPNSRRPRAILLGDEMFAKVGGFVLGNLTTSLIAGVGTFIWLLIFGIPYPLLLALMVALLDLIPIVGSTVGGIVVSLIALTVSLPVAIATALFYMAFRLAEDYLLVPRIIGRVVQVPATVTFVAVLFGGATLGILGALVAIPVAAAIRILLQETVFPRLDRG
jgi:predicted PurR-regulated permease PerM